jgi:hypothetical protein
MTNALTLARERQEMQSAYHREMIRQGLVAALADKEVQGKVIALLREQLDAPRPDRMQFINLMEPADVDALLSDFNEDDAFIFH